jgi:predicted RNase H-like HicB family nuclease
VRRRRITASRSFSNGSKAGASPCSFSRCPKSSPRDTEQEALANAEEAIRAVLAFRRDNGLLILSDARPEIRRVTVAA